MKAATIRLAALLLLAAALAACGSVPPPPVDRFYRLQAVSPVQAPAVRGPIHVAPLRADSLYAERPLVWTDTAEPRQLRQYHYHLWLYPPAQLVEDHLRSSLASAVELVADERAPRRLDGRILRFERSVGPGRENRAVVAVEWRLSAAGRTLLERRYEAEQPARDESVGAFVVAMEEALARIYGRLAGDLAALPVP